MRGYNLRDISHTGGRYNILRNDDTFQKRDGVHETPAEGHDSVPAAHAIQADGVHAAELGEPPNYQIEEAQQEHHGAGNVRDDGHTVYGDKVRAAPAVRTVGIHAAGLGEPPSPQIEDVCEGF